MKTKKRSYSKPKSKYLYLRLSGLALMMLVAMVVYLGLDNGDKTVADPLIIAPIRAQSPTIEPLQPVAPKATNITAKFLVYINGSFRTFSGAMYHNQTESVFIPSDDVYSVKVLKESVTWSNFFDTLPFKLEKNCLLTGDQQTYCTNATSSLKFYLNGILDEDALTRVIKDSDRLLISYGNETALQIQPQINKLNSL